uniref:sushi, von Willebrand factor type A, EGF and pentraxin domain-containing protein 1-like n=1 Tax=Styela clava TaxID=7725 RepID=UPI00193A54D2|nr:sushi, von Willebrand factor type A, EGF and pentraxin domain-containing protein 1-like [Styela clava]
MTDGRTIFSKMGLRKILHCFVVVTYGIVSISSVNYRASRCPPTYYRLHDRLCYKISSNPVFWTAANRACTRDKGSLMTMKSAVDVDNLRQIMSRSQQVTGSAFIGIIDRGDGAGYANLDETNIPNPFWEDHTSPIPQQLGDPRCGYIEFPGNGEWKSGACGARRKYICSYVPMDIQQRTAAKKQIRCHVCHGESSNQRCNARGTVLCPPNAGSCQNEVRVVNGKKTITKRCKQTRACMNNFLQNSKAMWLEAQCKPGKGKGSSVCRCCCEGNGCNAEELPCLAKGCDPIRVPKDGRIKCTDQYMVGSLCTFSCDFGFSIQGSKATRCTGETGWTSPVPECIRTQCAPIMTAPDNGSVVCTNINFGASTCRFKCDYGYYLRGLSLTTCLGTSRWSVERPTCHLITCDRPLKQPENGRIVNRSPGIFGEITTFECVEKYFMVGNPGIRCTDRNLDGIGEWTNKEPTCRLIQCSALKKPLNGRVDTTTQNNEVGTLATFNCNEGYFLVGNPTLICEGPTKIGFGKWSGKEPKCAVIKCPKVTAPINGEEIQSTTSTPRYGTVITFTCKFGYFRNGAETSICVDQNGDGKGEWTNKVPTCKQIVCLPNLKPPTNGRFVRNGGSALSTTSEFACDRGYFLLGTSRITCQDENNDGAGEWSQSLPTCRQIKCEPFFGVPSNGGMICSKENDFGTNCQFSCDTGFFLSGSTSSSCVDDNGDGVGEWRNPVPTCEPIVCSWPLSPSVHGSVSCSEENLHGSECEFKCEEGYWLKDSDLLVCEGDGSRKDGKWSRNPPICFEINCDRPLMPPEFGSVSCDNRQKFGSACTFSCETGYHLVGDSKSVCRDVDNNGKGEWSGNNPSCKESSCRPSFNEIKFGKVTCSNENGYGSLCQFQCNPGYKLSGEETVSCGEPRTELRATWSSVKPKCEVRRCSEPKNPVGGKVVCSDDSVLGSVCTFSCDADRYLNGKGRKTCITEDSNPGSDVIWNDPVPICQMITCKELESTSDLLTIKCTNSQLSLGTVCAFDCKEGYSLVGKGVTQCAEPTSRDVGTWTNSLPTCQRIKCQPESLSPLNGTVECTDGNFYGSVCTYQCGYGYILIGESTRKCLEDSAWDNLEPECATLTCDPRIEPPENGISTCSNENYIDSVCQSFCNLGYNMDGEINSRCVIKDDGTLKFTNPSPTCTPIYCDDIAGPIEGGNILCGIGQGNVEGNRYDTTCFLSCSNGWRAIGSTRTTCLGFGEWEGGIGRCEKIICQPPLGKPPRGDVACNRRENIPGTACTFKCNPGLQLDRNGVITCQDNGQWSSEPPACVSP